MGLLNSIIGAVSGRKETPEALHIAIMRQSLLPDFYGIDFCPDTFAGRFEMTTLHSVLLFRRLRELGPAGNDLSDAVFKELLSGFDDALREIGTGDLKVGKKMRQLGEAFYGRAQAYDEAIASDTEESLMIALKRNMQVSETFASNLALYCRKTAMSLADQIESDLLRGTVKWISPEVIGD